MADPITREQVERAIVAARVGTVYLSDFLGPGINWSLHAPDYVCRLWISPPRPPQAEHIAALTRWRDELAAARRVALAIDTSGPITIVAGDGMRLAVNGVVIDGSTYRPQPGDLVSAVWAPERPAPEVVDVPQPETWHARLYRLGGEALAAGKACAEAEAAFTMADAEREKARLARAAAREVCHVKRRALTEATTARAIVDAQQGGAS
jgi:hypothetical protein